LPGKFTRNKVIFTVIAAIVITLPAANHFGEPMEKCSIRLYQKIMGKGMQTIVADSSGIPMVHYQGKLGKQYNPVTIAEQALNYGKKVDPGSVKNFWNCIGWFIKNQVRLNDSSIICLYHFDWPAYRMTSPWRSAMCQGRAMQLFVQAFEKTGNPDYLVFAGSFRNALFTEVKDGGLSYKDPSGFWYEEYADDQAPQSRVLNGMIVVLQALKDHYDATKDPSSLYLFNEGVRSLKSRLPDYDNHGHSYYDILKKPASNWYHNFHVKLLGYMYSETGDPVFREYYQKWSQYEGPSYLASFISKPDKIRAFTISVIFLGSLSLMVVLWFLYGSLRKYLSKEG
jgi:hypothetical protein